MKIRMRVLATLTAALLLCGCSAQPAASSAAASASSAPSGAVSSAAPASSSAPSSAASSLPPASSAAPSSSKASSAAPSSSSQAVSSAGESSQSAASLISAAEQTDWSWFDDAVFIGDSVSLKLKNYVVKQRQSNAGFFGKAQFLTSGSLGSGNALWDVSDKSVHPSFQGTKMLLEDSVLKTGAKKVYIMLGINDVGMYGVEDSVKNMGTLLERIKASVPSAEFYVQSATPILEGKEKKVLNNKNLEAYDAGLKELCGAKGYHFVDVASVMRDSGGFLPEDYCSDPDDMGIHFTDKACKIWIGYLCENAKTQKAS